MRESCEISSALTYRLGIVAGAVLGGMGGYLLGVANTPTGESPPLWAAPAGAAAGFAAAWAVLTWLARKDRGAGVIAGGVLMAATVLALLAWFAGR